MMDMKRFGSLLLSGFFVVLVAALWLYPKINTAKHDTYVRVVEKPSAISHWEAVKKNVDAAQEAKKAEKVLVNPERFDTKKVSVNDFVFDEDMYGRGMHYEPYIDQELVLELDSAAVAADTTAAIVDPQAKVETQSNSEEK
jgi:hypothetical protein